MGNTTPIGGDPTIRDYLPRAQLRFSNRYIPQAEGASIEQRCEVVIEGKTAAELPIAGISYSQAFDGNPARVSVGLHSFDCAFSAGDRPR